MVAVLQDERSRCFERPTTRRRGRTWRHCWDQVTDTREPVLIRRRGKEAVALIAADELAGWFETAHLLRSPENARRLLEASERADAGLGEVATPEDLGGASGCRSVEQRR